MEEETTKKFETDGIRRQWDGKNHKWYFSIVDIINVTTSSTDPRNYWKVLKNRLKKAQNQLVTECNQLKMMASDGKFYMTDVADAETMLKLIAQVSAESIPPFEQYFATFEQITHSISSPQGDSLGSFSDSKIIDKNSYPQFENLNAQNTKKEEELMLMIDGYRLHDVIFLKAFIAGVDVENLSISVTCNTVSIKGERPDRSRGSSILINQNRDENNINGENYSEQELCWGKFSRTIELPNEIEINKVEVSEYKGMLTIKLPVINKNRTKIIKMRTI
jgi:HSP20 family molecular chaperone IbpA